METKEEIATKIIREFNEKFRSKDSPPLDARQLVQFAWIIDRVWEAALEHNHACNPEVL